MRRIDRLLVLGLVALLLAPAMLLAAGGSSAPPPTATSEVPKMTPQQKAVAAYNQGLKYRDKAWKMEEVAAGAEGAAAEKAASKAEKAYKKAAGQFRRAVDQVDEFHQAWSSLGYTLRKLGDYEESLAAYDRALAIEPRYTEAIEYRGEAYLGLNRIEEAKGAYMQLFQVDRERAAELMTAMKRWLETRRASPEGVTGETLDEFAAWLAERGELVAQVGTLAALDRSW